MGEAVALYLFMWKRFGRIQEGELAPLEQNIQVYWLCQSLWLCGSQQTVENSERDGHTRPPDLPLEKPTCMQVKKQQWELDMEQQTGSKEEKEYVKTVCCHPCLFNLYAEYVMQNAGLDEAQAWIKIAGRNINNVRYADDTTFMAESEEELKMKDRLMKVKEESEKIGLKFNIQKTKIVASGPITSWKIDRETMETVTDLIFLGSKITADGDCSHKIKRRCSLEDKLWPT